MKRYLPPDSQFSWLFLLGAALLVRLVGIIWRPIWYDEAFALLFARAGPTAMVYGTLAPDLAGSAADIHPLGYYTLLWGWMKIFGESVASGRLLSIFLGLGSVALVYGLGLVMFDRRTAWWGAIFAALAPFLVHYSQEIRMYALLAAACLGATLALWQGLATRQKRWWVAFALCSAIAQYTHNLAVFFSLPLALTPVLMRNWRGVSLTLLAGLGAVALYLPWMVQLPAQLEKIGSAYWTTTPGFTRLITTLLSFVTNLPLPDAWLPVGLFATLTVVILAAWQTLRAFRKSNTRGEPTRWLGAWLAYLAFVPPIFLFLFSQFQPVYIERALVPSGAIFCLWLAWAFTKVQFPKVMFIFTLAVLFIGFGMGLYQHLAYTGFPYAPYQQLTADIQEEWGVGDIVLHSNKLTMLPSVVAAPNLAQSYLADIPGSGSDTLALPTQEVIGWLAEREITGLAAGARRVWFIVFNQELNEYERLQGAHPHLTWLQQHYGLEKQVQYGDLTLYVFSQP